MNFNTLHQQTKPLLLCNVWDVKSAQTAEQLNFSAIGTSSAAIAHMLGYEDGEQLSFNELSYIIQRIVASTSLPLTVDIESGFATTPTQIIENIISLAKLGVSGINIEDSIITEQRSLKDAEQFSNLLQQITSTLKKEKIEIFINVRTDTFLLNIENALQHTLTRIKQYQASGANGIFVPCVTNPEDIAAITASTSLPINVMCMPDLPSFDVLAQLNVKRISMGNFVFEHLASQLEASLTKIQQQQSFAALF